MTTVILMTVLLASSCLGQDERTPYEKRLDFIEEYAYPTDDRVDETYEVNGTTPDGVRYDSNGVSIDEAKLDLIVDTVYACLIAALPDGRIPQRASDVAACDQHAPGLLLPDRDAFVVKIADVDDNGDPEWRMSCHSDQQVLNVSAPSSGCEAKGLHPDQRADCSCSWRSMYRTAPDGTELFITTPSMYMLSDAMTRFMTGCVDPWATGVPPVNDDPAAGIRACARPVVPALPQE